MITLRIAPTTMSSRIGRLLLLISYLSLCCHSFIIPVRTTTISSTSRPSLMPRSTAFIEIEKTNGGSNGDHQGSTVTVTERAWNSSMGALPTDLSSLTKEIADCALMAIANGEMGLTVRAGGEFEMGNKFYDPFQFTTLVVALAAKLSVWGQTRVLFAGPDQLDSSLEHMRKLIAMEAQRDQDEMATVAAVRRQVQAKYPGTFIPEMPAEMAKEKAVRQKERQRLAENVRWASLMGRYRLTGDSVTDLETAPSAVFGEVDLDNDRMFIIVAPGSSPAEMLATRKLIKAAGKDRPVIVLNHNFDPEPLEMSVFTEAYHLDICKLKRPRAEMVHLPSQLDEYPTRLRFQESPPMDEVETVLIRKFPFPWQVFGNFGREAGFELVDSYESMPAADVLLERVMKVVDDRSGR